jgi:TP901 family phage tail tape measure protein
MASNDLKLQVLFDMVDKVTKPLKDMLNGNKDLAKGLKDSRTELSKLKRVQDDVDGFRKLRTGLAGTSSSLKEAEAKTKELAKGLRAFGPPSQAMVADLAKARAAASKLRAEQKQQAASVEALRVKLSAAGIDTRNLSTHERTLRSSINSTTAAMTAQQAKLEALNASAKRHAATRERIAKVKGFGNRAGEVGMKAGMAGVAVGAAGVPIVRSYAELENARADLQNATMTKGGNIPAETKALIEQATRQGDRLPGSTADFINMTAELKRQGLSNQAILGGTGEATALLAVQLKMLPADMAKQIAQLQDSTGTSEKDMVSLADQIQRGANLGVDTDFMVEAYSKASPIKGTMHMQGIDYAKAIAPILTMANQSGMNDGGSAGNALRKIVQQSIDLKHIKGANKLMPKGQALDFTDGKGHFAGLDKMFVQLQKLKAITNDQKRGAVLKQLFGDDAETMQVVNLLIDKGKAGYDEVKRKTDEQASLNERVENQLKTLASMWDATTGTFTNALAALGESVSPELKSLVDTLGQVSEGLRKWADENPNAANTILKLTAIVGGLLLTVGAVGIGLKLLALPIAGAMSGFSGLISVVSMLSKIFMLNPWGAALALLVAGAVLIYENWDKILEKIKAVKDAIAGAMKSAGEWFGKNFGVDTSGAMTTVEGVPITVDDAPPVQARQSAPMSYTSQDTYHVEIHDAHDPKAVGDEVKRQLAEHARNARLKASNRLDD